MEFPRVQALIQDGDGAAAGRKKKKKNKKSGGFQSMGLSEPVFRGVMKMGYKVPTPIQRKTIPFILAGRDVVAMARTGSGKTAAFLIPLLEKLREHLPRFDVRSVVISPTRELALQTNTVAKSLGRFTTLKFCLLVGGSSMDKQFAALSKHPDVIIATPGRLVHHLLEVKFSLKTVEFLVFDEADRLFEMGFAAQLRDIMAQMSTSRQTLLFSATMPKMLAEFTRAGLRTPEIIRLDVEAKISDKLKLAFFTVRKAEKPGALLYVLKSVIPEKQQALIFAATKHHVEMLIAILQHSGVECCPVYGSMDSASRKINIAKFRGRKIRVMVVTDVAARGIDIPLLDNVINYDFPSRSKLFVHRVGRVARAGREGTAYSLVSFDERAYMVDLFLFLGRKLRNKADPNTAAHNDDVGSGKYNPDLAEATYYGSLPSVRLGEEMEFYRSLVAKHSLSKLVACADRAYKMYYKTRSGASYASVQRGKTLEGGVHPMFSAHDGLDKGDDYSKPAENAASLLSRISNFRAKKTIFEQLHKKNKVASDIMLVKRRVHERVIESKKRDLALRKAGEDARMEGEEGEEGQREAVEKEEKESGEAQSGVAEDQETPTPGDYESKWVPPSMSETKQPKAGKKKNQKRRRKSASDNSAARKTKKTKDFRDPNFFMSALPSEATDGLDVHDRSRAGLIDKFILELDGDDADALQKQHFVRKWDARKKKYIKVQPGMDPSTGTRRVNEAGARISKKYVPQLYEKWKSRATGPDADRNNDNNVDAQTTGMKRSKKGQGGPKDELKSKSEIRKERQKKERRKSWLATKKGKKKRGGG